MTLPKLGRYFVIILNHFFFKKHTILLSQEKSHFSEAVFLASILGEVETGWEGPNAMA